MPQESSENFFTELLKFVIVAAVIVVPIRFFVAQPFIVSGASMFPTFHNGEYLIVDELTYRFSEPVRGDVVIFKYPRNPSEYFIKRIIALPNETLTITNDSVTITATDGSTTALAEPYTHSQGNGSGGTYTLGPEQYFVMGDNRAESSDSRTWGTLPRSHIVGRAFVRLFPLSSIEFLPGSTDY